MPSYNKISICCIHFILYIFQLSSASLNDIAIKLVLSFLVFLHLPSNSEKFFSVQFIGEVNCWGPDNKFVADYKHKLVRFVAA